MVVTKIENPTLQRDGAVPNALVRKGRSVQRATAPNPERASLRDRLPSIIGRCGYDYGALMPGEQILKSRDQNGWRAWFDLDNQTRKTRCQGWREIHRGVDYEGYAKIHEDLHQGRTVPIHQIYVQDRSTHDPGRKEGHGFIATCGRTDDFAAGVRHCERQIQGNERLILGHKD